MKNNVTWWRRHEMDFIEIQEEISNPSIQIYTGFEKFKNQEKKKTRLKEYIDRYFRGACFWQHRYGYSL